MWTRTTKAVVAKTNIKLPEDKIYVAPFILVQIEDSVKNNQTKHLKETNRPKLIFIRGHIIITTQRLLRLMSIMNTSLTTRNDLVFSTQETSHLR